MLGKGDLSQADEVLEAWHEDAGDYQEGAHHQASSYEDPSGVRGRQQRAIAKPSAKTSEANRVTDEAVTQRQPPAQSWTRVLRDLKIDAFRPLQMQALDQIEEAYRLAEKEQRMTTAAIVIPTGAGKDLLPLAWSFFRSGVSIMFVPFKHLAEGASQYCKQFNGKVEVFDRSMTNTAANLVLCAYEQASYVVPLVQNLAASRRLAGTFVNECQVLALDSTWREFEPMSEFFGLLTSHSIVCPVVFMTATLRHPETVLKFCGYSPPFDTELFVSPMRQNLTFQQLFFPEGVDSESCRTSGFLI